MLFAATSLQVVRDGLVPCSPEVIIGRHCQQQTSGCSDCLSGHPSFHEYKNPTNLCLSLAPGGPLSTCNSPAVQDPSTETYHLNRIEEIARHDHPRQQLQILPTCSSRAFLSPSLPSHSPPWLPTLLAGISYPMLSPSWLPNDSGLSKLLTQQRVGNIGDPCYDHGNGCSLTGAMVSFLYSLHSFVLLPWPINKRRSSSSHANGQIPGVKPEDGSSLF